MNDERPTNGQRAALALAAVSLYAQSSPAGHPAEITFFFDHERDALPGGDQDRLSGLLAGLMHYAERRRLSFDDALTAARQEYRWQRTTYVPGNSVRRTGPGGNTTAPDDPTATGEVISARPGRPAEYLVDFITSREWLREPDLAPAPPFPALVTAYGAFSSAFVARHVMDQILHAAENAYHDGQPPAPDAVRDLDTILTALSGWSGIGRDTLLRSFSNIITENDGQLIAGALTSHPVTLANASAPVPPGPLPRHPADAALLLRGRPALQEARTAHTGGPAVMSRYRQAGSRHCTQALPISTSRRRSAIILGTEQQRGGPFWHGWPAGIAWVPMRSVASTLTNNMEIPITVVTSSTLR